jgi:hypothetical protein
MDRHIEAAALVARNAVRQEDRTTAVRQLTERIATLHNLALRMQRMMRSVSLPADDIAGPWQEVLREADQVLVENMSAKGGD